MSFKAKVTNKHSKCLASKFFSFGVNICLDLCESATTDVIIHGNHSINQDSALFPMRFKMLMPISFYLVRGLNRDVMRN